MNIGIWSVFFHTFWTHLAQKSKSKMCFHFFSYLHCSENLHLVSWANENVVKDVAFAVDGRKKGDRNWQLWKSHALGKHTLTTVFVILIMNITTFTNHTLILEIKCGSVYNKTLCWKSPVSTLKLCQVLIKWPWLDFSRGEKHMLKRITKKTSGKLLAV